MLLLYDERENKYFGLTGFYDDIISERAKYISFKQSVLLYSVWLDQHRQKEKKNWQKNKQ